MKKIYLISPREPSGATWLINCFLELGIKTFRDPPKGMWKKNEAGYALSPHEEILKKWLPNLWKHDIFKFRDDIEIQWSHEWPTKLHDQHQVIYFVRDPRDALYSRYKRESPDQSFEEFIQFPDVNTLLNKIDNWRLFNLVWLDHPDHKVFRFEDYKLDANKALMDVLDFIGLDYSSVEIDRAVNASTYKKAVEAESRYRTAHPEDNELINRGGKAGEWQQGNISQEVISRIEDECADVMQLFGYVQHSKVLPVNYSKLIDGLPFLQHVKLPQTILDNREGRDVASIALGFAHALNRQILSKAKLRPYEVQYLLDSLDDLTNNLPADTATSYADLRKEFQPAKAGLIGRLTTGNAGRLLRRAGLYSMFGKIYRGIRSWKHSH